MEVVLLEVDSEDGLVVAPSVAGQLEVDLVVVPLEVDLVDVP